MRYCDRCSRWHRRRVLPQGAEQIESGADRGRCSFSPLDPRCRSSFSLTPRYPDAALSRSRPRCPEAAPTRSMSRPTTARISTGEIVLQPDLDSGWGSSDGIRDRVATGSRRRMAFGIVFPLLQSCRGWGRWLVLSMVERESKFVCVVLWCASCFHCCNCEF
jgi:hypothetical protein